jgi:hypothetical protein
LRKKKRKEEDRIHTSEVSKQASTTSADPIFHPNSKSRGRGQKNALLQSPPSIPFSYGCFGRPLSGSWSFISPSLSRRSSPPCPAPAHPRRAARPPTLPCHRDLHTGGRGTQAPSPPATSLSTCDLRPPSPREDLRGGEPWWMDWAPQLPIELHRHRFSPAPPPSLCCSAVRLHRILTTGDPNSRHCPRCHRPRSASAWKIKQPQMKSIHKSVPPHVSAIENPRRIVASARLETELSPRAPTVELCLHALSPPRRRRPSSFRVCRWPSSVSTCCHLRRQEVKFPLHALTVELSPHAIASGGRGSSSLRVRSAAEVGNGCGRDDRPGIRNG